MLQLGPHQGLVVATCIRTHVPAEQFPDPYAVQDIIWHLSFARSRSPYTRMLDVKDVRLPPFSRCPIWLFDSVQQKRAGTGKRQWTNLRHLSQERRDYSWKDVKAKTLPFPRDLTFPDVRSFVVNRRLGCDSCHLDTACRGLEDRWFFR